MLKIRGVCSQFGCKERVIKAGRCEQHQRKQRELGDRPSYHELYKSSVWVALRKSILDTQPLCVKCAKEGRTTLATVVDHMIPHRGNINLFLDANNLKPLCASCHGVKTGYEALCRKTNKDVRGFYE